MTQIGIWCHFPFREKLPVNMLRLSHLNKSLEPHTEDATTSESEEEEEMPSPLKRRNKSFVAKDHEDPHADPVSSEDMEEDIEESRMWGWAKKKKKKSQFIVESYSTDDERDDQIPKVKIKRLPKNKPRTSESDDTRNKKAPNTPEPAEKRSNPKKRRSPESYDDYKSPRKSKSDGRREERSRDSSNSNYMSNRAKSSSESERPEKRKRKKLKKTPKVMIM
jgi:hypothetical protein